MSSIQRTMRTCTRGASGAGVSVPAARGIPNSRAPSCHLERACRLRLAAGTRAAPQRSWRFLRTLSVSVIGDSSGAGMSLKPSVPGSGRLWDPPSHAGRPCGTPARACTASAWMDQIRGEAVRLMSSEGSAAVYVPIRSFSARLAAKKRNPPKFLPPKTAWRAPPPPLASEHPAPTCFACGDLPRAPWPPARLLEDRDRGRTLPTAARERSVVNLTSTTLSARASAPPLGRTRAHLCLCGVDALSTRSSDTQASH